MRKELYGLWHKRTPAESKNYQLKSDYGVDLNWYWDKLKEQGEHCALCPATHNGAKGYFAVDHDHVTGEPRGLLCNWCNRSLQRAEKDIGWLDRAKAYLIKYRLLHDRRTHARVTAD